MAALLDEKFNDEYLFNKLIFINFCGSLLGVLFKLIFLENKYFRIEKNVVYIKICVYILLILYNIIPIYFLKFKIVVYIFILIISFICSIYKALNFSLIFNLGSLEIETFMNGMSIITSLIQIISFLLLWFKRSLDDLIYINFIIIAIFICFDSFITYYFIKFNKIKINNILNLMENINIKIKFKIFYQLFTKNLDFYTGIIFNNIILYSMFPFIFSKLDFNIKDYEKIWIIHGIIFGITGATSRRFSIKFNIKNNITHIFNIISILFIVILIINYNIKFSKYIINYIIWIMFTLYLSFILFKLQITLNNKINLKYKCINGELNALLYYISLQIGSLYSNILVN